MGAASREDFAEASFALVSSQYMLLCLHLGYHFTTFESLCTEEPSKNYIRMQLKGGGASGDRRVRRVALMTDLLSRVGFEHACRGDFLDTRISYLDQAATVEPPSPRPPHHAWRGHGAREREIGWYTKDLARKLGLEREPAHA
jgi:hypothetical protein